MTELRIERSASLHIRKVDDPQQQSAFFVPTTPSVTIARVRATYVLAGKVSLSQCRPCQRASVPMLTKPRPAASIQQIRPWPVPPSHQETSSRSGGNISSTSACGLRDIRNSFRQGGLRRVAEAGRRPPAAGRSATSNSGCLAMFSHDRTVACALLPLYLLSLYLVFGVATESPDGR
jgi:hypothetical protein